MKKISFMLCAAALMLASTFTSCTNEDNSIYENNVVIRNGYYLNDIIADAIEKSTGNDIVVNLPDTIALRSKADVAIEIPEGKNVSIIGKAGAPARVQLKCKFLVSGNLTIKNVDIDAQGLNEGIIPWTSEESKSNIIFENVTVKNFASEIIGFNTKGATVSFTNCDLSFGWLYSQAAVTIKDSKLAPTSTIYIGNNDVIIDNVEIDATNNWNYTFATKWPGDAGYEEANEAGWYIVDEINLKNLKIKGIRSSLFYNWYNYVFKNFNVDNVEAEFNLTGNQQAAFTFGEGGALNFNIQNSHFYAKENSYGKLYNFVIYGWGGDNPIPDGAGLGEDTEWSFVYKNNVFENIVNYYWHEGGNYNKVDLLSIDIENNTWKECQNAVGDIDIIKTLRRWHEADDLKSVVVKNNTITQTNTYDFVEAAARLAADEAKLSNLGGSKANGTAFYAWEKADKTNSFRQDYKGYQDNNYLPTCHVWCRSDRYDQDNTFVEGGFNVRNDKEMVIDGLYEGSTVQIFYDATEAKEENQELLWAVAVDDEGKAHGATATVGGADAVSGETKIPSGAKIVIKTCEPTDNGSTGYFAFKAYKKMAISKVVIVNQREN